jgi:hypothetical protein
MIHTDEDDEFERIEHEAKMRSGQPYIWDVYVSPSQRNQVLEECAKLFDDALLLVDFVKNDQGGCLICGFTPKLAAEAIRAMKT